MRTNLVQTCKTSANRINLNRTIQRVALISLFISLGIGNAWGNSDYYSQAGVAVKTGAGTVYVGKSTSYGTSTTGSSVTYADKKKTNAGSAPTDTWYIKAVPDAGYVFTSWTTGGSWKAAPSTSTATTSGTITASTSTAQANAQANFTAVSVSSAPANIDLAPTDPSAIYPVEASERTLTFTTSTSNALTDFTNSPANGASGKFTFSNWRRVDATHVAVDYQFTGGGSYGGVSRTNSVTVSLKGVAHSTTKSCTITANFPNAKVNSGSCDEIPASFKASDASQADKAWTATFEVENVDGENNFDTPTFTGTDASHFTYNSMSISGNTVTVNFTYNGNKEATTHTATLTLKVKDAIGGTDATYGSKGITVTAVNEEEPDYDVEVRNAGGTLISNNTTTWAQGLSLANNNAGSTIKLMRDINLGTITATNNITKATTIDLNGKELRAAVDTKQVGVLTINANVAVTIKDSKTGGRIINEHSKNAVLYTINVAQGTLNLESGTISIHNTIQQSYGTAAAGGVATSVVSMGARAIQQAAATTVNIKGGRVEAYGTRAVYGIRTEGSKSNNTTLNISNGEVYAEAPAYVYAVFSNGKLNVSGGTITAKINNEVVNENTAYMEYIRTNNKLWDNRTYGLRGFGYGILLQGVNSVTATSNYFGTLNMTGGTVNVINVGDPEMQAKSTATDFIQSPLYGVCFNAAALNVKTGTASDGSYSQKYAAKGSITGGTISVTNSGRQSYGVYVMGHYNSFDNTSAPVVVKNCTINVSSYYESYGVYANATIGTTSDNASPNMGACYAGEVELTGATVTATTTTAATAYALFAHAATGIVYKNATWTKAKAAGYTQVYDGEFGAAAKITVNSGTYTATSATTTAYAVGSTTRAKTVWSSETSTAANKTLGGNAEAYPVLILHGGTFRGETGTTTSGAVLSGGYTTIDGGTYTAYSGSTTSRGIYATAGTLDVSNVEISASGTTTAYGIDLSCGISDYTGFKYYADATLKNLTVTATTRTGNEADAVLIEVTKRPLSTTTYNALSSSNKTSYGSIYQYGEYAVGAKCSIIGGTYTATAQGANAFGVSVNSASLCEDVNGDGVLAIGEGDLTISNAKFTVSTKTGATAYGVWAGGKTSISNSTFNVTSATSTAYGLRAYYGKSTIKNSIFDVTATTETAVGLRAEARMSTVNTSNSLHTTNFSGVEGYELVGEIETEENTVTVRANGGNTAYGIQVISAKGTGTKTTADAGLAFNGDHACAGTATINGGKYTATASGTTAYAVIVSDPVLQGEATATPTCIINDGKFKGTATSTYADVSVAGEPGYFVLNGGYYVKDENLDKKLGEGMNKVAVKSGTPEYTEGYRWRVTDNMTGEYVCKIKENSTSYASLEEALQVVNASPTTTYTIIMIANYTLSKGDYVLPANTTLLIPYQSGQTAINGATPKYTSPSGNVEQYEAPTPLYKLTFANGVNMSVYGKIEASAVTYLSNQGLLTHGTGVVSGKYGWLYLNEGSHIDLESGAALYAWGYVTGKGEINAKNGSAVYEDFQMGDWRGGTAEMDVNENTNGLDKKGVFLVTHYYYQNIECPITYRAGAQGFAHGGTYVYGASGWIEEKAPTKEAIKMIGTSGAMFLMDPATAGEDTWVRKEYDTETDYVNWTMNSGAKLGSVSLKISASGISINLSSSDYVLPITSNFNIVANYGEIDITNHVCFIPGSKLTIKKEGVVNIPSGQRVFFYDQDDWKSYSGYWFNPYYSPSWKVNPRVATIGDKTKVKMPDAEVLVEGLLNVNGAIYTTAGGANIHSTRENAGKVKFGATLPAATAAIEEWYGSNKPNQTLCQWVAFKKPAGSDDSKVYFEGKALNPAWLKNEDGTYSKPTSSNTSSGDTWVYMQSLTEDTYEWTKASEDGCFTIRSTGDTKTYVHPSDWVAVGAVNANHAYPSEDGTRMFVNTEAASTSASCKWWDVNPTPEVIDGTTYYVANNENFDNFGTYYYWDNTTSYWKPKKITVTWQNEDGTKITNGTYGDLYSFNTSPQFFGTNPKKTPTAIEKYDWIGWRDAEGNIYDKNATLPRATSDVTYTAYFNTTKYQYTITFKNDDNSDLWAGLVDAGTTGAELQALFEQKYNEKTGSTVPQKAPTVDKVYTFDSWNTALQEVTGAATYTATYTWVTRKYHVTFYNYDAASVLYETDVDYNTRPVYAGVTPFRANTSAYSYEWTGWQPHYGTTDNLALVTGDVYYVATFAQTELKYQVLFKRQDGSIIDAPFFNYEETPVAFPANPTLASTVSTDYTFDHWDPATLTPVTEDGKVYTAYFSGSPRKYTAHFVNYNGTSLNADQKIDYNTVPAYTGATPIKPNDSRNSYEFSGWAWPAGDGWEAGSIGISEAFPAIKGDITFTAQFNPVLLQFNVIYQREDGTFIKQDKVKWGQNTEAPAAADCNYEDEQYTYTLSGWSPATIVNPVTTDATYTAQFNHTPRSYSVTLNTNGGTINAGNVTSYTYGTGATLPTNVTRTGYGFSGWYDNSGLTGSAVMNISATATGNKTYWAKWTVHTHAFAWDFAGGSTSSTTHTPANNALAYGSAISYPANNTMTKTGYTFASWSSSATTMPDNDLTITANWSVVTYSLTYEGLNGATNSNPATYTIETATITLANPGTRAGYTFTGWTCGGSPITQIILGSTGDKVITANWEKISVTILWKSEDGETTLETDEGVEIDATPSFNGETPTKITTAEYTYTFDGWTTEANGSGTFYAIGELPAVSAAATYYAHFSATANVASVKVGSADPTYYTNLADAFAAANSAESASTIKLLNNVSGIAASLVYSGTQNCTLDLNNHTIAGTVTKLIDVNATGTTFTIDDSSTAKGGKISLTKSASSRIYCLYITAGTVNLKHGIIYCKNSSTSTSTTKNNASAVYVAAGQKFIMDDGTVESISRTSSYALYIDKSTTSEVTINGGLIKGHTNSSTTAGGIYNYCTKLTINGGHIIGHAYTSTSYGINQYGKSTINGGIIEATNDTTSSKGTATAYGIFVQYNSSTYNGAITIPSSSTVQVLAKARTNTAFAVYISSGSSSGNTIAGGTFTAIAKTGKTAIGVYSFGTITISGGIFNVSTATTAAYGIYTRNKTTTVSGSPVFNVTSGSTDAYGAFAYGYVNAKGASKASGTIKVNGGTFNVTSGTTTAYGAYAGVYGLNIVQKGTEVGDTIFGQHYMPGIIEITDATFNVKATTTGAYGIVVSASKTESGAVGTTKRYPKATISGGKFKAESAGDDNATAYAMNASASATYLKVQGGKYSTKRTNATETSNIEDKYTAPTKSCNYHVLPLTGEDPYKYEVAEAYTITFNNYDGTPLQSSAVKKGATPVYSGATPTKAEDESYTYSFSGWDPEVVEVSEEATYTAQFSRTPRTYDITLNTNGGTINAGNVEHYTVGTGATLPTNVTKSGFTFGGWFDNSELTGDAVTTISTTATGDKQFWAKWNPDIDDRELDIVDWTSNSITINVTNLKAVGGTNKNNWKIRVNGTDYTRTSLECSTQSRTLTISGLSLTPNENLLIQLKNDADVIESQHNYKIPQIYTANATLSETTSSSVVYVYGGKLTISGNTELAALYVCPGAEVEVTGTLTVGKLVLRTKPWATAAISGNVSATNVYYTRIAPDGSVAYPTGQYYQFGLPYACAVSAVHLSDGTTPAYNTTWILKSYNEERRAESGTSTNNWDALAADATIEAGRGYEMFSSYKYYREYYFPVTPTDNKFVSVTRHDGDKNNSGWNIVCSPLMSIYQNESDPVTGLKVSWLLADGSYDQEWPETIWPALPFSYQASATGYLDFSTNDLNQAVSAPRRAAYKENIQTEWIHLDVKDGNGVGDHTSVFVHPDRFEATYQTGIDVAKQSFEASRALIYSSHAYGEMAFAGVADVLLENGVALTVYSPKEQELTISMRDNEWLDRMADVWLIDNETGAQIDLLDSDYTFEATAGTTTGRFILMGRFFAPQIATDIDEVDGEQAKPKKLIIRDKLYILINDQLYDGTGKMVK